MEFFPTLPHIPHVRFLASCNLKCKESTYNQYLTTFFLFLAHLLSISLADDNIKQSNN